MRLQTIARGLTVLAIAAAAPGGLCPEASAQARAPRTVLTINWGAEDFPGSEPLNAAIRKVLDRSVVPVNYFAEYLESEEFPPETASISLRDYIHRKYEGRHIDVVITVASAALQFALRYRAELFPGVPIVFLAVAPPQVVVDRTATDVTGIMNDDPFSETLELVLNLHPSAKRVFVVAQAPSVEGYDQRIRSALSRFSDRAELTYIKARTVPALLAAVKAVPPQSVVLYTRYTPNEAEHNMYPDEIARLLVDASRVPIYSINDVYIGSGVVGGMMRSDAANGTRVGEIARQILDGRPPESIPITDVPTTPTFDWRQVKRWGIDQAKLPAGSRLLFRTPTAWETYRWYIITAIIVVGAQLLLIMGLLTQRAMRQRAEGRLRLREASLRKSYERIQLLAGRIINAQESARVTIAQDLHDDICQRLAMVTTAIDRLRNSSGDIQNTDTQRFIDAVARDTRQTFDAVRRLSHDLHPATLRVLGLVPALKAHCAEVAKGHDVEVAFTTEDAVRHVPDDVAICFFRIAQEALRNGVVHGAAHQMAVSLTRSGDDIEMTVTDDGHGFDLEAANGDGSGVGVITMEERARAVGGSLYIVTGLRRGTTIRVRAPLRTPRPVSTPEPGVPTATAPAGDPRFAS
jgi:signal transduction histidine kinase